jgi:hypothetical protein
MKISRYQAAFSIGFIIPTYLRALNSFYIQIFSRNTVFFILMITYKLILCDAANDWFETSDLFSLTISHTDIMKKKTGLKFIYLFCSMESIKLPHQAHRH